MGTVLFDNHECQVGTVLCDNLYCKVVTENRPH